MVIDSPNDWPVCENCGGIVWKVGREQHVSGFEDQSFTCSACGHITERTVVMSDEDLQTLTQAA
jgi:hypothetical protein